MEFTTACFAKKKQRNRFVITLITSCLILLVLICFTACKEESVNQVTLAVNNIKAHYLNDQELDYEMIKDMNDQLLRKETAEKLSAEEYFLLGFFAYYDYKDDTAKEYLAKVIDAADYKTNSFVKSFSGIILHVLNGDKEQSVAQMNKIGPLLTTSDWIESSSVILDYIYLLSDVKEGQEQGIQMLDNALLAKQEYSESVQMQIMNCLGVLYIATGNYGKAIDQSLAVLMIADRCNNKYFTAKAIVDMSAIYNSLLDYERAKNYAIEASKITIDDPEKNAYIKTYALANLCEALLGDYNFDSYVKVRSEIEYFQSDLSEEYMASMLAAVNLYEANYLIHEDQIEDAGKMIKQADELLQAVSDLSILNIPVLNIYTKAQYYAALMDYETAEDYYLQALELSQSVTQYTKQILNQMIELYCKRGDIEKAMIYNRKVSDLYYQESIAVNQSFAEYSIEKFMNEQEIMKFNEQKLKRQRNYFLLTMLACIICIVVTMKIISLSRLNHTDGLTKCYNRKYFEHCYAKELLKNIESQLIMFDIDDFKKINDTYGHIIGDEVLQQIAMVTRNIVGKDGEVFRYGGEEFVVLSELKDDQQAVKLAENIRTHVEQFQWKDKMKVTISLGVACRAVDHPTILERADERLYQAKKNGKNQVISWI